MGPKLGVVFAVLALATVSPVLADPGIGISGRVVTLAGAAVPAAQILLIPARTPVQSATLTFQGKTKLEPEARALTDATGSFRVEAPHAGLWSIRVTAKGYAPIQTALAPVLDEVVIPDAMLPPDDGLAVTVLADGKPLKGALVRAIVGGDERRRMLEFWRPANQLAITKADGSARLARPGSAAYTVTASASGFAPVARPAVRSGKVTLTLKAGAATPLEVRSADGKPAPGVLVTLGDAREPLGFTDEKGLFTAVLPRGGESQVDLVGPDGAAASGAVKPAVAPTGGAAKVAPAVRRFVLSAVIPLVGKVVDIETRKPVAGALVWEQRDDRSNTLTDEAGMFSLPVADAGRIRLTAQANGYLRADPLEVAPRTAKPTFALSPAAAVEGHVVDGNGAGVALAEVRAAPAPPAGFPGGGRMMRVIRQQAVAAFRLETRSRADGSFRVPFLDPDTAYDLLVRGAGFAPGKVELSGIPARRTKSDVKVVLTHGMAAIGKVVDRGGKPISGADVTVHPAANARMPFAMPRAVIESVREASSATSNADGVFRLVELAGGKYDVTASRAGFAPATLHNADVPESADTVDLGAVTLEPGEALEGRVVDGAGRPIEGAEVFAMSADPMLMAARFLSEDQRADAITGSDGRFVIQDRRRGEKVEVVARREGYSEGRLSGVGVPPPQPVTVTVRMSSRLEGRVVDSDERPVPSATVTLTRDRVRGGGMAMMAMRRAQDAQTDDEGKFVVDGLEAGKVTLRASAAGYEDQELDGLEIPEGKDLTNVVLTLRPGAWIEGHVYAPGGSPAVGARVARVGEDQGMIPGMNGGAVTDGDGYYRLDGLRPGTASVEARADGYPRAVRDVELTAGPNSVDLRLEGGQDVAGRVVDESGQPIPRADVSMGGGARGLGMGGPGGGGGGGGGRAATTGDDGNFILTGVTDGDYQLIASRDGYASSDPVAVKVAGQPVAGLTVVLRGGGAIYGSVLGLDPADLPQVQIMANRGAGFPVLAQPDSKGAYRLDHLAPGDWSLIAQFRDGGRIVRAQTTLGAAQVEAQLDLTFPAGFTLTGRAVLGDAPVTDAFVMARPASGGQRIGNAQTDYDGRFRMEGLDKGVYTITLNQMQQGLTDTETVELSGDRDIVLRLPQMRVAGRVLDAADRSPVQGVVVTAGASAADQPPLPFLRTGATTDSAGAFELNNVPAGNWRLVARKSGYSARDANVTVAQGSDTNNVEILIDATEGLTLLVTTPAGHAPDAVRAVVLDGSGQTIVGGRFSTGENGRVQLSSVPAGSWRLLVAADGTATSALSVVAPGAPISVSLLPGCELDVQVTALANSNAAAFLTITGTDGRAYQSMRFQGAVGQWPVDHGRARISDLPPGSWNVTVRTPEGGLWQGSATTQPGTPAQVSLD